ncbi:PREDICTED: glutaredoxin-related protein 5, mitochondrial [Tinamus guttatus]|uniref:glutaredoxin-related protein 5, mitochondrial n=1 Tax=Tinamus guttatus TaxID=94827 RepID=UPI00052EE285|nr:PREDICTED: glutaredoxin-related protein 5, mitochondrial [Tinamus guttatus]
MAPLAENLGILQSSREKCTGDKVKRAEGDPALSRDALDGFEGERGQDGEQKPGSCKPHRSPAAGTKPGRNVTGQTDRGTGSLTPAQGKLLLTQPERGIKNYSNWPTIPQVYLNGEFVGGCDILLQMHQSGDLVEELKKLGIRSALLDAEKDQDKK